MVHEQRIVAETLARRLEDEDDIRVVGIATSDAAGRSAVDSVGPDVAIIDADRSRSNVATELIAYLVSHDPPVKIVTILDDDDASLATQVIRAGADAVMTTDDAVDNLIAAVLTVAQGHAWVVPRILGGVFARLPLVATTTERIRPTTRAAHRAPSARCCGGWCPVGIT